MSPVFPLRTSLFLSFLLALNGMLYELALAQVLSVVLGGTLLQYSVTIGLFTLALGISGLIVDRMPATYPFRGLFLLTQAVIALSALAALYGLKFVFSSGLIPSMPLALLFYLPALWIGLLTGFELPLLLKGFAQRDRSWLLGADYSGMFAATLLFPLFLLPVAGPLNTGLFSAFLNLTALVTGLGAKEKH